ncbi:hypothetical protein [Micropruina sp.]|uniref:hypothetical protein n=1 Tax=Micropruina sp. TaxID=2737536 RepID=UPI0039E48AF9
MSETLYADAMSRWALAGIVTTGCSCSGAKGVFGTYKALAVIAHLLPSIEPGSDWAEQMAALLRDFPASHVLTIESIGAPRNWESLDLWRG